MSNVVDIDKAFIKRVFERTFQLSFIYDKIKVIKEECVNHGTNIFIIKPDNL